MNLKIADNQIPYCRCSCEDYRGSFYKYCKHGVATILECINPHKATTSEGMIRFFEKRREMTAKQNRIAEEERQKETRRQLEMLKKQEELKKKKEYEEKYQFALAIVKDYEKNQNQWNYYLDPKKENKKTPKDYYDEVSKRFYETKQPTSGILNTNIAISARLETNYSGQPNRITFKLGSTTMYKFKDLRDFYDSYLNGTVLDYGKKLRFIAKKENFNESYHKLFDFIINCGKILNMQGESTYYGRESVITSREIFISQDTIRDLIEALDGNWLTVVNDRDESIYKYDGSTYDTKIKMTKNSKTDFMISASKNYEYMLISGNVAYFFEKGKIYKNEYDPNKIDTIDLIENLRRRRTNSFLIPAEKMELIFNQAHPEWLKNIDISECKDDVEALLNNYKLSSKMFLDVNEDNEITLQVKFCYGDVEKNIFDNDYASFMDNNNITRNRKMEKTIIQELYEDGFIIDLKKKYLVLRDDDKAYDFLSNKIEKYMNDFEILVSENFKSKEIKKPRVSNVSIKLENGLLELDLSDIKYDFDELKKVLQSYSLKKKYYKLKSGDFLSLEKNEDLDFLEELEENMEIDFKKLQNGKARLPVMRGVYLERLLSKNKNINASKNKEFNSFISGLENNGEEEYPLDDSIKSVLRSYQKRGFDWLKGLEHYEFGGILADDMGLGKTLQIIALLSSYYESNSDNKQPSIVVCPSSLTINWKAEIEKWNSNIKVEVINGNAETRKLKIDDYMNYNLLITSYDSLKRDCEDYENKSFMYIIADEAQYIKNNATQNATALKSLNGKVKFALTGTPIENSIAELWSIFDFIMPGYLYSYHKFKNNFENPIIKEQDEETLKRLKTLIEPFVLRRVKKDVLTELPEKNITVLKNEMTDEQRKIYTAYMAQIKTEVFNVMENEGFEKNKLKILMLLTRLRQICCHPSLFIDDYHSESGKLQQCIDLIKEAIAGGHRILLFSQYTSMFEIIKEVLNKEKIVYFELTGKTKVDTRIEMVDEFNKNTDIKIFLISLKAGGTGLNLTGADTVIHYDPWWNLSAENQATDRAYRIGQKNSVQVYKLITANSIEEKINELQQKKAEISDKLLSTEETFVNKLSKEEIMSLFE